jgi:hypothetical protein
MMIVADDSFLTIVKARGESHSAAHLREVPRQKRAAAIFTSSRQAVVESRPN